MSLTALKENWDEAQASPELPEYWRGALNALRMTALRCRADARDDLFQACALLTHAKPAAQDAYTRALFRCLSEALGTRAVFFRPGEHALSFDEAWLTRLLMVSAAGDGDSLAFLIRSRVPKMYQRHIAFLIKGISEQFSLT